MRIANSVGLILALVFGSLPARAHPPFAALIVYALDERAPYLLLAGRADAGNVWTGFTANPGWADVEDARISAIRNAVGASRCYFSFGRLDRMVEVTYFRNPWESPVHVIYFARVPNIARRDLGDDRRDCPENGAALKGHSRLGWVPWEALRADVEAAVDSPDAQPVRLIHSARYLPGADGEPSLLPEFAASLREMISESGRKDSTIEFTLPW